MAWRLCGLLLVLVLAALHVHALHDGLHPLVVDYDEKYYYYSLKSKMTESLSISNCTVGGDVKAGRSRGSAGRKADIVVRKIRPPVNVVSKWNAGNKARPVRLFAMVTDALCASDKYKNVLKGGEYAYIRLCIPMPMHKYAHLCTPVHLCTPMPMHAYARLCTPMHTYAHLCTPMPMHAYAYAHLCTYARPCTPLASLGTLDLPPPPPHTHTHTHTHL
jgi:hypothetical protein